VGFEKLLSGKNLTVLKRVFLLFVDLLVMV